MKRNKIKARTVATLVALAATTATTWAADVADTLVIEGVDRVKIETRDTVQRIVISGSKDDPYLHYIQRIAIRDTSDVRRKMSSIKNFNRVTINKGDGKQSKVDFSYHLALGISTMTGAPDGCDFKVWPSIEVGIVGLFGWRPFGNKNVWSAGVGFDWRNYRSSKDTFWAKDAAGAMVLTPYDATQSHRSTRLHEFSLQVPLLYTHHFDNDSQWGVTLGALVNFNVGANAKRKFEQDNEKHVVTTQSIGQRPVTVDALLMLRVPHVPTIYCKYCPMTFFKDNRGPEMHQLSIGLYL